MTCADEGMIAAVKVFLWRERNLAFVTVPPWIGMSMLLRSGQSQIVDGRPVFGGWRTQWGRCKEGRGGTATVELPIGIRAND